MCAKFMFDYDWLKIDAIFVNCSNIVYKLIFLMAVPKSEVSEREQLKSTSRLSGRGETQQKGKYCMPKNEQLPLTFNKLIYSLVE